MIHIACKITIFSLYLFVYFFENIIIIIMIGLYYYTYDFFIGVHRNG